MNTYEKLLQQAANNDLDVVDYPFSSDNLKGLYCDNTIAINSKIKTLSEKTCILAEELGHYHTTFGNIVCQASPNERKQELRANIWAYENLVGLFRIVEAYSHGCSSAFEMAEYLEVTESFLLKALAYYKQKYGTCIQLDQHLIYFEPSIAILKLV